VKLDDTAYQDLVDATKKHVNSTQSVTVQRFKFNNHLQQPGESVSTYVSELHSLAKFCNFSNSLDDMLRDHIVCGINDGQIQQHLLAESVLTLKRALKVAQILETAAQNTQALQETTQPMGVFRAITQSKVHKFTTGNSCDQVPTCFRCGKSNHTPVKCKFKDAKCLNYGKVGHIKPVC